MKGRGECAGGEGRRDGGREWGEVEAVGEGRQINSPERRIIVFGFRARRS